MRAMATGVIAEGYLPDYKREPVDLWNEAKVLRTARFQGELIGEIYEVTNVSGTPMQLAEHEFTRLGTEVAAVAIERHSLAPKQTSRVYVVQGKGLGDQDGK
jgi:conjugal transfer pilus assembly protein TraK